MFFLGVYGVSYNFRDSSTGIPLLLVSLCSIGFLRPSVDLLHQRLHILRHFRRKVQRGQKRGAKNPRNHERNGGFKESLATVAKASILNVKSNDGKHTHEKGNGHPEPRLLASKIRPSSRQISWGSILNAGITFSDHPTHPAADRGACHPNRKWSPQSSHRAARSLVLQKVGLLRWAVRGNSRDL